MKKVSRNDPCPCGSGKKYKNCCLNKSLSLVNRQTHELKAFENKSLYPTCDLRKADDVTTAICQGCGCLLVHVKHRGIVRTFEATLKEITNHYENDPCD